LYNHFLISPTVQVTNKVIKNIHICPMSSKGLSTEYNLSTSQKYSFLGTFEMHFNVITTKEGERVNEHLTDLPLKQLTSPEACDQLPFCFSGPVPAARPVSEILTVVGVELAVVTTVAEATMPWPTCSSVFPASLFSAPPNSGAKGA
jgi:hypothetical protein